MHYVLDILSSIGSMAYDAGVYVIVGVLAAGLVHIFVSRQTLTRHLGGGGFVSVLKAALLGAPLPLCSCSVLPTAYALRERGAGRGATVSFLISTPETSFDSIAVTWALMGPIMAVVRPVAAVVTALTAGMVEALRGGEKAEPSAEPETSAEEAAEAACPHCEPPEPDPPVEPACAHCESDAGPAEEAETRKAHDEVPACPACEPEAAPPGPAKPLRWRRFWRFVALELGDEIGPTLALGLVLAGIIGAFVDETFFERYLGSPVAAMLVMLVVGLPLYVCATASTPMAAMLVWRGLNPGAALVFLLVGPATNLATVLTVGKMFGKLSAAIYVGVIAAFALACGFALDAAVGAWEIDMAESHAHGFLPPEVHYAGAVVLAAWLAVAIGRWVRRKVARRGASGDACCDASEAAP